MEENERAGGAEAPLPEADPGGAPAEPTAAPPPGPGQAPGGSHPSEGASPIPRPIPAAPEGGGPTADSGGPGLSELLTAAGRLQAQENERRADAALREIQRLDPAIQSWEDVAAGDTDRTFYDLVFRRGMDEVSAFKAVFFDRLVESRTAAARQAALNEARSKSHLAPVRGQAAQSPDLTDEELAEWAAYGFSPRQARSFKARFARGRA